MFRVPLAVLAALLYCSGVAKAAGDVCVYRPLDTDSYLFSLYERAPKFDDSGHFGWKDEAAAKRANMSLKEYVIGGVNEKFRRDFARAAQLMELWGFDPTINSAYRGDYRQSLIRGGGQARVGRSFHGGSRVGGWGHGLAIDTVSARATSNSEDERLAASKPLWDWIDTFGPALGIGRAYGNADPPHVTPIWSREYVARHDTGERSKTAAHRHRHHVRIAHK